MNASEVEQRLLASATQLADLGVASLSLFGSVARGDAGPDSDLDFLVQFEGIATFERYMSLKELLEREMQTQVDLVTLRALKPLLRDRILGEAIKVA